VSLAIGIAGCGGWGVNIVRDLVALEASVLVADPDPSRRAAALGVGARDAVGRIDELASCAGYIVATPARSHRVTCAALLERGAPVFVEKPPGTGLADVEALAVLGVDRLFVMHKWRYHPGIVAMSKLVGDGIIGEPITLATTRTGPQPLPEDVDVTWHLAVHDVSIALDVLGSVPSVVDAEGRRTREGRLIRVDAMLGTGSVAHRLVAAAQHPTYRREIRCVGSEGTVVLPGPDSATLDVVRADGFTEQMLLADDLPLFGELGAFLAHCDGGPRPKSSMPDALAIARCLATIDATV
jgi:predicted dehydrogenase